MARYLIEVPHDPDHVACDRAARIFLATGSHFMTHADYGRLYYSVSRDGLHWELLNGGKRIFPGKTGPRRSRLPQGSRTAADRRLAREPQEGRAALE